MDIKEDNQNGNDVSKDILSQDNYTTAKNVYIKIVMKLMLVSMKQKLIK